MLMVKANPRPTVADGETPDLPPARVGRWAGGPLILSFSGMFYDPWDHHKRVLRVNVMAASGRAMAR